MSTVPKDPSYAESSNQMMSIKEVFAATDNLSAANLIGQGVAGNFLQFKDYCILISFIAYQVLKCI